MDSLSCLLVEVFLPWIVRPLASKAQFYGHAKQKLYEGIIRSNSDMVFLDLGS